MPQSGYDQIASEYYNERHITSRNFDSTTRAALKRQPLVIPECLVLEIGAGRGRAIEYLEAPYSWVVHLDNSAEMLQLSGREKCLLKLHADACKIPLSSQQFGVVAGFLIDPFFGLDSLAEAYRMLVDDGQLIITVPTQEWGKPLRERLGINSMTTRFKEIDTDNVVVLPSLLHSKKTILEMLELTGFRSIEVSDEHVLQTDQIISEDIKSVCTALGRNLSSLPIVHVIRARR